jgi:hypothetical protein
MSTTPRIRKVRKSPPRRASFRNIRWCLLWAALVVAGVGGVVLSLGANWELPALLFLSYALQALIAEFIGVRVAAGTVSMPRRPAGLWAIALFWRARATPNEIDSLISLPQKGLGVVELERAHGGSMRLLLPNKRSKHALFEALLELRPGVPILRAG